MSGLSFEVASSRLRYEPDTGKFFWKSYPTRKEIPTGEVGSWDLYGYKTVRLGKKSYKLHRIARLFITGVWPTDDIDHINGVRHDNRGSNLRETSRKINLENRICPNPNKASGLPLGVWFDKSRRAYGAKISHFNKSIDLGLFSTIEAAEAAYLAEKRKIHEGFIASRLDKPVSK